MEKKILKLYLFKQNNSGGSFDEDEKVAPYVIIQAYNAEQANALSSMYGIYFNGVEKNMDCDCCGDRWYEVDEDEEIVDDKYFLALDDTTIIHYLNGTVKKFFASRNEKIETPEQIMEMIND